MKRFSLRIGLVFVEGQTRWTLLRKTATGLFQLENTNGEFVSISLQDLLTAWRSGRYIIDEATLGKTGDLLHTASPKTLTMFSERERAGALRRKAYLDAIGPSENPYQPAIWRKAIEETAARIGDPKPPAPSTAHRWWQRFRHTQCSTKLVRLRPKQAKRDIRIEIFEAVVAEIYLNRQNVEKKAVVDELYRRIDRLNAEAPNHPPIKHPSNSSVYRWLSLLEQDVIDRGRLSADAARVKHRSVSSTLKVEHILDRVEIDHTAMDVIVIDTVIGLPLGRPWLTMVLDRCSRMPLGFYLTFSPPSTTSVLAALRHAMLPKHDWCAQFPIVLGNWPCYGIPLLIAVDNGMDLHSQGLEDACQDLGIDMLFCPAKEPFFKGSIERFFRTLNSGLIHRLPGTTFSNPDARGDYPSEDLAVIDLPTLNGLITKWIVDVYAITCRIPDDNISPRSWRLAVAREGMVKLLAALSVSSP